MGMWRAVAVRRRSDSIQIFLLVMVKGGELLVSDMRPPRRMGMYVVGIEANAGECLVNQYAI